MAAGCVHLSTWRGRRSSAAVASWSASAVCCAATRTPPAVAVVTGDAGIGKTRLLAEVLHASPDVLVLAGACLPLSESLPYGAITDALAGLQARPVDLSWTVRWTGARRMWGRRSPRSSRLCPTTTRLARTRPWTGPGCSPPSVTCSPRSARERRTALVVEDLHWADSGTLDLLTFLVRGHPPGNRPGRHQPARRAPGRRPCPRLARLDRPVPGVEPVALAPLSDDDVGDADRALVDAEPAAPFVAEVLRRGEGNPFFTEQLVAAAARRRATAGSAGGGSSRGGADAARSGAVGRRRAAEVAAALAVAARPLTEPELAACVGTGVEVAAGLRELLDAHLVEPGRGRRYRLRHALLEDTVRGDAARLTARRPARGRRGGARRRAGEAPGEVAAHWGRAGSRVEEARWSVAAARHAEGLFAWREASASWRRVWDLWSSLSGRATRCRPAGAVVGCVHNAAHVDLASDRSDPFLDLAREALADERVSGDDYATAQLLSAYGTRLVSLTGRPAVRAGAGGGPVRACRPPIGRARTRHPSARDQPKLYAAPRPATRTTNWPGPADIAEQGGHLDAVLDLTGNRGRTCWKSAEVEEALAVLEQAQAAGDRQGAGPGHLAVAVQRPTATCGCCGCGTGSTRAGQASHGPA